jgi:hypothetical protein
MYAQSSRAAKAEMVLESLFCSEATVSELRHQRPLALVRVSA